MPKSRGFFADHDKEVPVSIIKCPDCNKPVSHAAPTCPHCGAPIAEAAANRPAGAPLTTTQGTSKHIKRHILAASACFWGGLLLSGMAGADGNPGALGAFFTLVSVGGLFWYIATKARAWWHHA